VTTLPAGAKDGAELLRAVLQAQEHERAAVAAALHEGVGQALKALALGLRGLDVGANAAARHRLERLTSDTLESVRHLALGLRPATLDDLGLAAALRAVARAAEAAGGPSVSVLAEIPDRAACAPGAAPEVELALFRVAQEAVDNIVRHARASDASIVVTARRGVWYLVVEDDGAGFDVATLAPGCRMGLDYARAWLVALGGDLRIESSRGGGTSVYGRVPVG